MTRVSWPPVLGLAALKVAVSLLLAGGYGWHRDELYYLASARHLALGYVDYPPLTPLIARLVQVVAPDSVAALRLTGVLAGAVVVVLAALIARELGGGRRAQVLAALAVVISPMFLAGNLLFSTVSFDQLVWALLLWLVARLLAGGDPRLWLLAGLVLGIGLETKYTVAGLAVALAGGLLLTPARRHSERRSSSSTDLRRPCTPSRGPASAVLAHPPQVGSLRSSAPDHDLGHLDDESLADHLTDALATRWPWLGASLALVVLAPNLWWQAGHGWDSVAYTLSHRGHTDGPVAYWAQQAFLVQPLLLPVVVAGAVWLWRSGTFRALALTAVLVEVLFFALGGKSYYPAPVYPLLYAAGAVWLERSVGSAVLRRAWMGAAVGLTLLVAPILLPVLPAGVMIRSGLLTLPTLTEEFGWPDLAREVAGVSASLPPSDRRGAMVLAANYGEAGALDLYGPGLDLPPVVSPHLNYYYWAPARMSPDVVIALGYERSELEPLFADVTQVGTAGNEEGVHNQEAGRPIFVCRSPREPLWQAWPSLKALD